MVVIPTGQDDKVREKKINPRNLEDEEEEEEDINTTKGWTEEIERRKLKWWEILLYQKEVKEGNGRRRGMGRGKKIERGEEGERKIKRGGSSSDGDPSLLKKGKGYREREEGTGSGGQRKGIVERGKKRGDSGEG